MPDIVVMFFVLGISEGGPCALWVGALRGKATSPRENPLVLPIVRGIQTKMAHSQLGRCCMLPGTRLPAGGAPPPPPLVPRLSS